MHATDSEWDAFITLLRQSIGEAGVQQEPAPAVQALLRGYQLPAGRILDIGTGLGNNAIPFLRLGYQVTLVDVSERAISYSLEIMESLRLRNNVENALTTSIEWCSKDLGEFSVVIGTNVFSFIHPFLFSHIMKKRVLARIESGGYFAGDFFGFDHEWSKEPSMTFVGRDDLFRLFSSCCMDIIDITDGHEEVPTVSGTAFFHTYSVIAKKKTRTNWLSKFF